MNVGKLLAVGRTADVHALGSDEVIKIPRRSTPAHWAAVEAELSAAIHRHGLPIPEARGTTTVDGRKCVVFERVDGPSMWQRMQEDPAQIGSLTGQLVSVQRMIHAAGIPVGVPDLTARLRSKVAECAAIDVALHLEAESLIADLRSGAALLHGDLHPGNVILSDRGPVVIDWFDAAIGHPIADVVRSSLLLRLGFERIDQEPISSDIQMLLQRVHAIYLDAWLELTPLESLGGEWEPILALARMGEGADNETAPLLQLWEQRATVGH